MAFQLEKITALARSYVIELDSVETTVLEALSLYQNISGISNCQLS